MIVHQIVCDECGKVGDESRGPHRRIARDMRDWLSGKCGWRINVMLDGSAGHDFCPDCVKRGKDK